MNWYRYDIREMAAFEYQMWYACMSSEKQERVNSFYFADDKKRVVVGEMLARKAIAAQCGIAADRIVFGQLETGKPYAKELPVEFNISHSGNMVVCIVDMKPVGIDVEQIKHTDLKVAKRVCTREELVYLFGHVPTEQENTYYTDPEILTRFFKLWTEKEAICKLRGTGIESLYTPLDRSGVETTHIMCGDYVICLAVSSEQ